MDDGGLAFPQSLTAAPSGDVYKSNDYSDTCGMTLLDYFAGQMLASSSRPAGTEPPGTVKQMAEMCYMVAEEMIKERKSHESK